MKWSDAAGSGWVTPSWVSKAKIKKLKEETNERDNQKK